MQWLRLKIPPPPYAILGSTAAQCQGTTGVVHFGKNSATPPSTEFRPGSPREKRGGGGAHARWWRREERGAEFSVSVIAWLQHLRRIGFWRRGNNINIQIRARRLAEATTQTFNTCSQSRGSLFRTVIWFERNERSLSTRK